MKLVILGIGGMGAISLSKTIAQIAMNKDMSVKSTEIHGMAKKGGLVEIYMKIGEGVSPYIPQGDADFAVVLDELYSEYAVSFLNKNGKLIMLSNNDKYEIVEEFGDAKFANSFILKKFIDKQNIITEDDALSVLKNIKQSEKNIEAFKRGAV